jgi:dienelactone hydrolase
MANTSATPATWLAVLGIVGIYFLALTLALHPYGPREPISLRGHRQLLRLYGPRDGQPVIVSSGDGGWIHLGPHVADILAARGFFVVGFDTRAYLASFTTAARTLGTEDVPGDYLVLAQFVAAKSGRKPILIGVSEGAGLSVLAATNPRVQAAIAGVVGLGLPDVNELGWRLRDASIYLTHRTPDEPTFNTTAIVNHVSPVPLALLHSTGDEFVPLDEIRRIYNIAGRPKRLWLIDASDHRFDGRMAEFDERLTEAIAWIMQQRGEPVGREKRVPETDSGTRASASVKN